MIKKCIFLFFMIFCLFLPLTRNSHAESSATKAGITKEITNLILDDSHSSKIIKNPEVTIKGKIININFEITKAFKNESNCNKFVSLENFRRKLRFHLFTEHRNELFYSYDLVLTTTDKKNQYKYVNRLINKQLVFKTSGQLYKNNKTIYSSTELKRQLNRREMASLYTHEKVNGHDDFEIFMYGLNFFNTLTKDGRYYDPETDNDLVTEAVKEKFGISRKQYGDIYRKYYLLY